VTGGNVRIGGSTLNTLNLVFDDQSTFNTFSINGYQDLSFRTNGIDRLTVSQNGNVGIGTAFPGQMLSVTGNIEAGTFLAPYGDYANPTYRFGNGFEVTGLSSPVSNALALITNSATRLFINNMGNVGVGTMDPTARLHVNGNLRLSDGTQAAGRILIADALGNASWTNPTNISDGDWTINGTNMYSNVSGNVGIGTTNPEAKLHVVGHIWQMGTGQSVFLGEGAGANDDLSLNRNVFVGTLAGYSNTSGDRNTAVGFLSLNSNTTGLMNTAVGFQSLYYNTEGSNNTAIGFTALNFNTTGNNNTAIGYRTLVFNTDGLANSAFGSEALLSNTEGDFNIAIGRQSLYSNTTGSENNATGYQALYSNTSGSENNATGYKALYTNTSGSGNTASGYQSLFANNTGINNVAVGHSSLRSNNSGGYNSAMGFESMYSNTNGQSNVAMGFYALRSNTTGSRNTALGEQSLMSNTSGIENVAIGSRSLYSNISSSQNIAIGREALFMNTAEGNISIGRRSLYSNTSGYSNIAMGVLSLNSNTSGNSNIAIGVSSLYRNLNRNCLIAIGDSALMNNGTAITYPNDAKYNLAIGSKSLFSNTRGFSNLAIGYHALYSNAGGSGNIAIGANAAKNNVAGTNIVAVGDSAMYSYTGGGSDHSTAVGACALKRTTTGAANTGVGSYSLYFNTEGFSNTAIGSATLVNSTTGFYNTAVGGSALYNNTTGSMNTAVGFGTSNAANNFTNCSVFGYDAVGVSDHSVYIGNTAVSWIGGHSAWHNTSDGRFKREVSENIPGLSFINELRPVSFHWDINKLREHIGSKTDQKVEHLISKAISDKENSTYTGFIAQEVENAAKKVGYEFSGLHRPANEHDYYSLAYSDFVVPLVKAVQELSKQNELQQRMIDELINEIQLLKKGKRD